MINHYKASIGCANLNSFGKSHSKITYKEMIADGTIKGQCEELLKLYFKHPEGLTDAQVSKILLWDCSTVSARRNDLTRKKGKHIIVTNGKRSNGKGRRTGIVWNINQQYMED